MVTSLPKKCIVLLFAVLLQHGALGQTSNRIQLPSLGEASAGLISPSQEYELGQSLLRRFRGGMPLTTDPFIEDYVHNLLRRLVPHSDLSDPRLEILILENRNLNAFAAPGGIVGLNTGTFLLTQTEHQLVAILAHELAHLSQRHYARNLQQQKTGNIMALSGLVAGMLMMASGVGTEAGAATMMTSQAAYIDSVLRFSREMEQEADRVGMRTMLQAGYDPHAVPGLFELMLRNSRFRSDIPEFLLTHPLTERRIADAASRAERYPRRHYPANETFELVRARAILLHQSNAQAAVRRFTDELNANNLSPYAARYGLVQALVRAGRYDDALEHWQHLEQSPHNKVATVMARADIHAGKKEYEHAFALLELQLAQHPSFHPLNVRTAELLMEAGQYQRAQQLLTEHAKRQPDNAYVWYLLAEVHGLAGNILEVHKARAEYFMLRGIYRKAEIQLRNALRLIDKEDFQQQARIEQRLLDVRNLQARDI